MGKVLLLRSNDSSKFNQMESNQNSKQGMSLLAVAILVFLVFALDQLTKFFAVRDLAPLGTVEVIPSFFSLTFVQNKGAAFGMFAGLPSPWREITLGIVSVIALGVVIHMLITETGTHRDGTPVFTATVRKLPRIALSLILGGAFGNLLDRVRNGAVVDFLDFYVGKLHWPAFNVADSSICLGVTLLLLSMTLVKKEKTPELSGTSDGAKDHKRTANV
jgi:signal peptidase II